MSRAASPSVSSAVGAASAAGAGIIGPYSVGPVIGSGIFAQVQLGLDEFRQTVAIKVFDKAAILAKNGGPGGSATGAAAAAAAAATAAAGGAPVVPNAYQAHQLAQIEKELNALRTCSHPHIVQFYDVLETEAKVYLVMEHLSSGELYDYILQQGRLSEPEAGRLFGQIVSAIQHVHQRGIVHRDLKPENILIRKKGAPGAEGEGIDVVLVDFGLANYYDTHQDIGVKSLRTQCGSPHYASPEVLTGQRYSGPLTDIWSLGVLLYAMLCGSLPFNARSIPALIKKIVEGRFKLPKFLSPGAQHLIQSILQIAPENRPSVQAILDHPWCRSHAHAGDAAAALEASQMLKPLSRPEVISPQSYTNARAAQLLQAQTHTHTMPTRHATLRGYHTVNANERSVVRIHDSDDEGEDEALDEEEAMRRETLRVEEGHERSSDEEDDPTLLAQGRAIVRRHGSNAEPQPRRAASPGSDKHMLPPSSVLSFQPDADLLLQRDASFSIEPPPGAQAIPSTAAAEAAGALEFAASPAANWGGTLKKVKAVNCTRCGKLLSARTNSQNGAIVLAGTSLVKPSGLGASLARAAGAPELLDLCQCAALPAPGVRFDVTAASAAGGGARPSPVAPIVPSSGGDVPSVSSTDANTKYYPAPSTPSTFREAHFGGTAGAAARRKSGAASPSRPLTVAEIAERESAYRNRVALLFRSAEQGDTAVLAGLICPPEDRDDADGSGAASPAAAADASSAATPGTPSTSPPGGPAPTWVLPPLDVRVTTIDSWNALHFASRNGHTHVVQSLLTCWQPLDINSRTKSGWTPLMLASDKGHLETCSLLLRYGAAIHVTNNDGKSAIFLARESGHPAIAQALTHASSSRHLRHTEGASARNNTSTDPASGDEVRELNHQLLQAAECGDIAKVKHLLQLGRSAGGLTSPTKGAAGGAAGEPRSPPSESPQPSQGRSSPSQSNARRSPQEADVVSPRYCVDIRARGIDNWSVLHFAARKGRTAVVQLLLEQDPPAELNALTKNGWTPLMLAADRGHADTCQLLLNRGADPTIQSVDKYTALSVAQEGGHDAIVALLSPVGAAGSAASAAPGPAATAARLGIPPAGAKRSIISSPSAVR